jgi:riboflavin biosynthesis pyrimidine reductase
MGSIRDRKFLEKKRSETDASLMGAGTLRQSDPEMRCLDGILPENRIRAIITYSGAIPVDGKKIFSHGPSPYIFTNANKVNVLEDTLSGRAKVFGVEEKDGELPVQMIIHELENLGVRSLLVEGGATLNYSCLSQGVIDELYITLTPFISGDSSAVSLAEGAIPLGSPFIGLDLISCEKSSTTDELFLHYKIKNRRKNG